MHQASDRAALRGQLSVAGILIGCVGCVIITASSVYTALKMGSLPWPTIFTSITALVLLRTAGRTSLNEANITQVIMSAGSMVAGGVAFTIPGVWMLGLTDSVSFGEMLVVALAGTLLGLVCTALIQRHFVEESDLEYPIGTAAAETLLASRAGGSMGKKLFGSMAAAGVWTVARDVLGWIPSMVGQLAIPGVAMGVQMSPMRLAIGFLVGGRSIAFWFAGALVGNFGIIVGGSAAGLWDVSTAQGIVSSLGMGLMMGSGVGVVLKDILPNAARVLRGRGQLAGEKAQRSKLDAGVLALMVAAAALLLLEVPPFALAVLVATMLLGVFDGYGSPMASDGFLATPQVKSRVSEVTALALHMTLMSLVMTFTPVLIEMLAQISLTVAVLTLAAFFAACGLLFAVSGGILSIGKRRSSR